MPARPCWMAWRGAITPLKVGDAMPGLSRWGPGARPYRRPAGLYRLRPAPEPGKGHDDFAGVDLKGKIAVVLSGGPGDLPGLRSLNARSLRARDLARSGSALGVISLISAPVAGRRSCGSARSSSAGPGRYLADSGLYATATWRVFQRDLRSGTVRSFCSRRARTASGNRRRWPMILQRLAVHFDLGLRLTGDVAASHSPVTSPNIIAKLEGSDPKLKAGICRHLRPSGPSGYRRARQWRQDL